MASTLASSSNKTYDPSTAITSSLNIPNNNPPSLEKAKIRRHLKFGIVGPLIVVIDSRREYCWTVWLAIGLGLVNLLIGAVNMIAMAYSAKTGDAHAAICTIAFHFFSAEAILSLNYANGWSTPMRLRHRIFAHVILQICGMGCAVAGTVLVIVTKGLKGSPHGITGIITAVLAGLSLLTGPCALFWKRRSGGRYLQIIHMSIGMPTFLVSSISLCLGFLTNAFKSWATSTIVYILIGFVSFYTVFIVVTVFVKCASRI